ncbi:MULTISPECIES: aldolase [Acidobacteriaceae]|uniref:aldolase n=1 Tax=Acidobacteriaceae TaxID=204434 RepID=UPI0020B13090|nr:MULTISPECIES: aldolase [Acidobacteriaceae]MDW5265156.1 aldolase [Edaphobacter sp.]
MLPIDLLVQTGLASPIHGRQGDTGVSSRRILPKAQKKDGVPAPGRPQDSLLYDFELPFHRTFYPLGFAVEIMTNDPDVLVAANESFGHRRLRRGSIALQVRIGISSGGSSKCPPEPTRREYNHLYSLVADGDNQALLDLKTCTSFVWLKKAALNNRLYFRYNFLEKVVYLLLGASAVTDIHAACISKNGKGILLCGNSGAGKSTLAYACARAGWVYTSDDTCYLINGSASPRVIGHSHRVRFRPEAKTLFPELENRNVTPRMEGKPSIEVKIAELSDLRISTTPEVKVHSIVYLNRYPIATGKLVTLPAGTATLRICQELFSAGEIREKHEKILQTLSDVPTYELHYCDLHDAIRKLDLLT